MRRSHSDILRITEPVGMRSASRLSTMSHWFAVIFLIVSTAPVRTIQQARTHKSWTDLDDTHDLDWARMTESHQNNDVIDTCTLSVHLSRSQYEGICPVREIWNIKKQIEHLKRKTSNTTDYDHMKESVKKTKDAQDEIDSEQRRLKRRLERAQVRIIQLEDTVRILNSTVAQLQEEKPKSISSSLSLELYTALRNQMKYLSGKMEELEKIPIPSSCYGIRRPGVYILQPDGALKGFDAFCHDGWTYFFRRHNGSVTFLRDWFEYKNGFGDAESEFWAGNENIYHLTHQDKYRLRIDAEDWNGTYYQAEYGHFQVAPESDFYKLTVKDHSGNLSNALYTDPPSHFTHHGQAFSTFDRDHDGSPSANCAMIFSGGWWYNDCYMCNPTGPYCTNEESHAKCMVWWLDNKRLILKSIAMAVKEVNTM